MYAKLITTYPDFTDGTYDKALIEQFCEDNKITCKFREEEIIILMKVQLCFNLEVLVMKLKKE